MRSKNYSFLLKAEKKRQIRKEILLFFDLLSLYVFVGYDLYFAWREASEGSKVIACPPLQNSINDHLKFLEKEFALQNYRFAFSVLRQLYSRGASLTPAIQSFARTLRKDVERDIENHLRTAPTRANICLILFFLPPALGLLILPFLEHLRSLIFQP